MISLYYLFISFFITFCLLFYPPHRHLLFFLSRYLPSSQSLSISFLLSFSQSVNFLFLTSFFLKFLLHSLILILSLSHSLYRFILLSLLGALVGAIPPIMGYAAATGGEIAGGTPLALVSLLFLWQFPHFFALSWLHREDYARGGFQMIAVNDPVGAR